MVWSRTCSGPAVRLSDHSVPCSLTESITAVETGDRQTTAALQHCSMAHLLPLLSLLLATARAAQLENSCETLASKIHITKVFILQLLD